MKTKALTLMSIVASFWIIHSAVAQDEVFVAQDGVNTGTIGAYDVSFGANSASGSTVSSSLITTPSAGASTEVRTSLTTDGLGDLFVGEWASGTTATIGEYSLSGTPINSSLLTLSDSKGVPQIAADSEGQLFVGLGQILYKYTTGGTLLNSIQVGPFGYSAPITAMAMDNQGDVYMVSSTGDPLQGNPYRSLVQEYTASGSLETLFSTPAYINSLAIGGGDIFASIQDGPPDIVNQVNEYTTGGSLVTSGLIPGIGGHLALDGQGHLLVDSYGDGTVSAYTTSGILLQSDVISGAGGAEDIVAIPVPEPSVAGLFAAGALGLFIRIGSRRRP